MIGRLHRPRLLSGYCGHGCMGYYTRIPTLPRKPICSSKKSEFGAGDLQRLRSSPINLNRGLCNITFKREASKFSRSDLLRSGLSQWEKLKLRFKYVMIKSYRPFNWDEKSTFFSWFVLGHLVWIIVGTTTFFSLFLVAVNTVFAQEQLARYLGSYLSKETGMNISFESAIVPKWKDGRISFRNVCVSRRPKGRVSTRKKLHVVHRLSDDTDSVAVLNESPNSKSHIAEDLDNGNYTQFELSIGNADVTFSLARCFNGKGIIKSISLNGVRGVVDRTHVRWLPNQDPRDFKYKAAWGDFEIDSFCVDDLLVTLYQPDDDRSYSFSIYTCELPRLRKRWLFHDILSANHMSGSFDDSLFTLHPRQNHLVESDADSSNGNWFSESRLRIDNVNIRHLNRGVPGPLGWIYEGKVNIIADLRFLKSGNEHEILDALRMMAGSFDPPFKSFGDKLFMQEKQKRVETTKSKLEKAILNENLEEVKDLSSMTFDIFIQMHNVRASVPLFTSDISYVNNALIRPIVAYINSHRNMIPLRCTVTKSLNEFEGSWTIYDTGLMDDISLKMYDAFVLNIVDEQNQRRRLKKIGFWSIELAARLLQQSIKSFV